MFVRTDTSPARSATRDADFSTSPPTWEGTYQSISFAQHGNGTIYYQSIVRRSDTLHVVSYEYIPSGPHYMHASKRYINGNSWPSSTDLGDFSLSNFDGRRSLTVLGDTVYLVFSPFSQVTPQLRTRVYKPATGWSASTAVESGGGAFQYPTISSSRTGIYFYWHRNDYATAWMKRKVYPLSGTIAENMFLTGKNWITDDLTIQAGVTVTLKDGSITYVSDNKKLIVANGGTLKKERGSQIVFGSGAKYQLNASLLNGWNMTGIPAVLANFDTSAVYPTATSNVFSYNGGYVITNPLGNNRGFFVKFGYSQNHIYEGGFIDSMAMNAYNGWNIIGSISCPIDTAMIYSDPPGSIILPYYKYNNGYVPVRTLEPGGGYWVKTSAPGKIILNLRSQVGSPPPQPEEQFDTYDRFTITDANGAEQDLYVRNAALAGTAENLEMPPTPPDAEFDARFAAGDFLRSVHPDSGVVELDIAVEALAYPVTLSWQLNPENEITYSLDGGGLGRAAHSGGESGIARSGSVSIAINGTIHLSGQSQHTVRAAELPQQFALHQNYPNPFNPETTIQLDLPQDARVELLVFDLLGRQVATLVDNIKDAGRHSIAFHASGLASGVYFYRLQATTVDGIQAFHEVKKLLLMR